MMPSEKNTKRVILALDQAYEKFIELEDKSTDEAEIVAYRCYYTNIYESKLYVEQMQKEIERLKKQEAMNVDVFVQWCIDSHIVGEATVKGIKYWVGRFKEGR